MAREALDLWRWTRWGWTASTGRCLLTIIDKFEGGPVGLETMAAAISEESDTIEDVYEPFLIQNGSCSAPPGGAWRPPQPTGTWGGPCPASEGRRPAAFKRRCFDSRMGGAA